MVFNTVFNSISVLSQQPELLSMLSMTSFNQRSAQYSVLTQLFFPKPPTTFLTCFCRGKRRKYAGNKVRLNWGSNSHPASQKSDMLTTEPPGWGTLQFSTLSYVIFFLSKKKTIDFRNCRDKQLKM